jgi:hypothetical protein
MKISFPWGLNVATSRRWRYLRIEIRPIMLKLWWWDNPKYDPEEK